MSLEAYGRATREAAAGVAACGNCARKGPFREFITVMFGGGLAYALCLPCAEADVQLMIRRGPAGIEILKSGRRAATAPLQGVDILTRSPR